ncbi:MAG TPA: DUF308 domain-containing protein [Terrimicrobiaceae bacterium]|nr:DUF308 domain-containing protein [Terrimicrobiaceae bacterium]
MSTSPAPSPLSAISKSRGWLLTGGVLSVVVGLFAISSPYLFSFVITKLIGAFALASGVICLGMTLFGKHAAHRAVSALSALVRIAAGLALLLLPAAGAATLTLILAIVFVAEGIFSIVGSLKMREQTGWIWLFLNGIAAIVLGLMVWSKWPSDSGWVLGLLYGINSLFTGFTLMMLGFSAQKPAQA